MGVTNRDASWLTQKRRGIALNAYYQDWKSKTVNSANVTGSPVLNAPAGTSAEVVAQIGLGCTTCYAYNNLQVQQGNTSSGQRYDSNVAVYPDNVSRGGASGSTGTS
jgi:hypothetical protein